MPQNRRARYVIVAKLADKATEILQRPGLPYGDGDLAEDLKCWAAANGIPYFDALPGKATPVEQAIAIAYQRRNAAARTA